MKKILITGGKGDLAIKLNEILSKRFQVYSPSRCDMDVTCPKSVDAYFSQNEFDFVINNAGALYSELVENSDTGRWINDINVNLIGTYLVSRSAVITNKNVKIINISSTAAFFAYKDWTSYCSSKAAVLTLSKGMALAGHHIITICLGAIDTKLRNGLKINNQNVMKTDEAIRPIIDSINGLYKSGDVIFFRKNEVIINPKHEELC